MRGIQRGQLLVQARVCNVAKWIGVEVFFILWEIHEALAEGVICLDVCAARQLVLRLNLQRIPIRLPVVAHGVDVLELRVVAEERGWKACGAYKSSSCPAGGRGVKVIGETGDLSLRDHGVFAFWDFCKQALNAPRLAPLVGDPLAARFC